MTTVITHLLFWILVCVLHKSLNLECTNLGGQVTWVTIFYIVALNIGGLSRWSTCLVTLVAPGILRWLPDFIKFAHPAQDAHWRYFLTVVLRTEWSTRWSPWRVCLWWLWLWWCRYNMMKHLTAAPKETHIHTLMIIYVELNVQIPETHVIRAVPWDLKVTSSTISQCLKCWSYYMVLFWLPFLCQELRLCSQYSIWPVDFKNRVILVHYSAGQFFAFSKASTTTLGPPSLLFNCIRGYFPRAKMAGASSCPLTSIWYWD
jgi:hypothetical protein